MNPVGYPVRFARELFRTLLRVSEQPKQNPVTSEEDLPEQMRVRREKRARLLASGKEPYPVEVERTHTLREIREAHPELEPTPLPGLPRCAPTST